MKIGPGTIVSHMQTLKTVKTPQKLCDIDSLAEISSGGGGGGGLFR